jgi:hypothetical protein
MKQPTPEMIAEQFALSAPIGTPCLYYPTKPFDRSKAVATRIRSAPWVLGCGIVVVAVEGMTGGKSIEHIAFAPPATQFDITDSRNRYEPCPRCKRDFGMGLAWRRGVTIEDGGLRAVECDCGFRGTEIAGPVGSATDKAAFDAWNAMPRRD